MTKVYESGDVKIIGITIGKLNGPQREVDLRAQVLSLSIYEDINEPSMILEIVMADAINLVQDYPIIGEEIITVNFVTPGRDNSTKKGFLVYSVDSTGVGPSGRGSIYTIKAVTSFHFFSAGMSIEKSYNDTVDEIVKDIVKIVAKESNLPFSNLIVEKTKGLVPITIPSLNPFQAIDMLRQKAISAEVPSGGMFMFFENQYGMQFKSIEAILKENKNDVSSKSFTYAPDTKSDKSREQYAFRNIIRYQHLDKFNSVEKIIEGAVVNTVESFDILSKELETITFKLAEKASTFTSTDSKASLPNSNQFIDTHTKSAAKNFFVPKDSSRGTDFIENHLGAKQAYSTLINQNTVRILVNGDNYIATGDVIELVLPEVSGTTERKTKDRLNSGNYLITRLRHIITMEDGNKPKHQIAMDCSRLGYK